MAYSMVPLMMTFPPLLDFDDTGDGQVMVDYASSSILKFEEPLKNGSLRPH